MSKIVKLSLDNIRIISPQEQVRNIVQNIYDNIQMYKDVNDIHTLKKAEILCIDNNFKIELSKMFRNIAMYHFYNGSIDCAIFAMENAINSIDILTYLVKWKSELGVIYFSQCDYINSRRLHKEVNELLVGIDNIDEKILHLHYYRYGLLENDTENYHSAEIYFRKSLEYAKTSLEMGDAITNIGLSFKLRNNYDEAIKYYNKALKVFEDDSSKSKVYNNLANLYKSSKEFDKALHYIQLAFDHIDIEDIEKQFIYYHTYAEIQIISDRNKEALNKLYELATSTQNIFTYKQYVLEAIQTLVNYYKQNDNINMLRDVENLVKNLAEGTSSRYERYLNDLYSCIGDITLYIMRNKDKKEV